MTDTNALADIEACRRLAYDFIWHVDHRDYDAVVALFADNGSFSRPDRMAQGHADLLAMLNSRPTDIVFRHVCSNVSVDIITPDSARGRSYVTLFTAPDTGGGPAPIRPPSLVGEYVDEYVRTPAGWRILSRRAQVVFAG